MIKLLGADTSQFAQELQEPTIPYPLPEPLWGGLLSRTILSPPYAPTLLMFLISQTYPTSPRFVYWAFDAGYHDRVFKLYTPSYFRLHMGVLYHLVWPISSSWRQGEAYRKVWLQLNSGLRKDNGNSLLNKIGNLRPPNCVTNPSSSSMRRHSSTFKKDKSPQGHRDWSCGYCRRWKHVLHPGWPQMLGLLSSSCLTLFISSPQNYYFKNWVNHFIILPLCGL